MKPGFCAFFDEIEIKLNGKLTNPDFLTISNKISDAIIKSASSKSL